MSDASEDTKDRIFGFLNQSKKCVLVVDCENSDPYKLFAALSNPNQKGINIISKIILYDDIHSSSAWEHLTSFVDIPIEHILIERVKESKSLVDIRLVSGVCKEHYRNDVDSFILASSDSDYWGLISSLPDANFLVMVEREKYGPDMKEALRSAGIFYCYLDNFYSGQNTELERIALLRELQRELDSFTFNINSTMDKVFYNTRVKMPDTVKKQFINMLIKQMCMETDKKGQVRITFSSK